MVTASGSILATRSGNKKVTLVNNLETYHIDPTQFAHKCQVHFQFKSI